MNNETNNSEKKNANTQKNSSKNKLMLIRRVIQLIFFVFLPALFINIFNSAKAILMFAIHQEGTLQTVIPNIILFSSITVVTIFAGRFFCGWMCAFGSIGDLLYKVPRIGKKISKSINPKIDVILKFIKYIVLAVFVIFVWGLQLLSIPAGTNPWDLFGILSSVSNWSTIPSMINGWIIAAVILLVFFIGSIFIERFFCRYFCPLGAYFSIISRFRITNIVKKRDECNKCTLCTKKCSMGIDLKSTDKVKSGECINCMECTNACPKGNAHLEIAEQNANVIIAGTVSCALIGGGYYLGNFYSNHVNSSEEKNDTIATQQIAKGVAMNLADGVYTGTGSGFRGTTTVSVEVKDGVITDVAVTSSNDDKEYINMASSTIIKEIIETQEWDVDAVSGATYSSNGIMEAVANAISSEDLQNVVDGVVSSEDNNLPEENQVENITNNNNDIEATDETTTSLDDGTDNAANSGTLANIPDGEYTGTGTGFRGDTNVTVTVSVGQITNISVDSYQDDKPYFDSASATIISEIIANQSVDVDAVSGATYSSNGIMEAVANALSQDFTPTVDTDSEVESEGGKGNGHKNR